MDERIEREPQGVGKEQIQKWSETLNRYRAGKKSIDSRTVAAERWWKMRNQQEAERFTDAKAGGFRAKSAWLHNVIVNKHADAMDAYPTANILPRAEDDKVEAWLLSKVIPVIMEQNRFQRTYDRAMWTKLKTGTGIYKITWDSDKLSGLGDIDISEVSVRNIFWEPGISDIQDSAAVFHTELWDKDELVSRWPELEGKALSLSFLPEKNPADDNVSTENKAVVIDVYYKRSNGGKRVLHYCKYVGDTILYATENDAERADSGLYEHGKYPFVFDCLFPVAESPCGYGYIDIGYNAQIRIDLMDTAFVKNTMAGSLPRYFMRQDANVNPEDILDLERAIIPVTGNLGEESIRAMQTPSLDRNHVTIRNNAIDELRETSGNTETASGTATSGVTAASAIAALQEASGKGSRDSARASYEAYSEIIGFVVELIRQFYDIPRQFRITGQMGQQRFISMSNQFMKPQPQGTVGGIELGYRVPEYDISIIPQKNTAYTKLAQNELALQLYGAGFFDPQAADMAMMCLDMMDFDKKDELMQKIRQQGEMFRELQQLQQLAIAMAQELNPKLVPALMQRFGMQQPERPAVNAAPELKEDPEKKEIAQVRNARERAATAAQPGGSAV